MGGVRQERCAGVAGGVLAGSVGGMDWCPTVERWAVGARYHSCLAVTSPAKVDSGQRDLGKLEVADAGVGRKGDPDIAVLARFCERVFTRLAALRVGRPVGLLIERLPRLAIV